MSEFLPDVIDPDAAIFPVSVAAALADMHPQTLRTYDRLGLVVPKRAKGGGRRYSPSDITKLRLVQTLSQDEGINLNGIRRIIEMSDQLVQANKRIAELMARLTDIVTTDTPRVFTAAASGYVATGRYLPTPLSLTQGL